MRTGLLYEYNEDKLKQDLDNDIPVSTGIDAGSLFDSISLYEIQSKGDSALALALLKQDLMIILGKIEVKKEK